MKRIPELDGIRGVAIAMVLLWHFAISPTETTPGSFWAYLQACGRLAWSGVDLFFVLSGFLIGGILLDSRDSMNYFRSFYTRRFFRIVPIYAVMLAVTYAFIRSVGQQVVATNHWGLGQELPWWPYALLAQNFWMATAGLLGFFGATWSLTIEEQFYLTLPAVVRFLDRRTLPHILGAGIVAAPLLRLLILRGWHGKPLAALVMMPCRADALLLGVLAAYALRNQKCHQWLTNRRNTLWLAIAIFGVGAGILTIYSRGDREQVVTTFGLSWLALLYICFILLV